MFYQKGIDITNDKQMFNFLKNHFEYWTMNSWNRLGSIANNVKLYNLDLSGDWGVAYDLLAGGEYETINDLVQIWTEQHNGFEVTFNGRSGGYLVLCNNDNNGHVLPDEITECEDYGEYKRYCKEFYGSVKANRSDLVFYTKLVQDFDKLCDELRDFCNELSKQTFEIVAMSKAVDQFNDEYADDLEYLEFDYLRMTDEGVVNVSEIFALRCMADAFVRICLAGCKDYGYDLEWIDNDNVRIAKHK
jgi:hypothetical protein